MVAEFEGKVALFEAALERGREAVPFNGINNYLGPLEKSALFEKLVISIQHVGGSGYVSGDGLASH
jgi:hypothetical protein